MSMIPCLFSLVAIGDAQICAHHLSLSWLKSQSSSSYLHCDSGSDARPGKKQSNDLTRNSLL